MTQFIIPSLILNIVMSLMTYLPNIMYKMVSNIGILCVLHECDFTVCVCDHAKGLENSLKKIYAPRFCLTTSI